MAFRAPNFVVIARQRQSTSITGPGMVTACGSGGDGGGRGHNAGTALGMRQSDANLMMKICPILKFNEQQLVWCGAAAW